MEIHYGANRYNKASLGSVGCEEGRRTSLLIIQDTDPDQEGRSEPGKPQGYESQQQRPACAPCCMETKDHNK